ncbi:MAG: hypothetical protein ACO3JL_03635 [Myxococcota bacterium]
MQTLLLATLLFGIAFVGMAIGVIVSGRDKELKGSCGGVGTNPDCCMTCPDKDKCDVGEELAEDFHAVAHRGGQSHPALAQVGGVENAVGNTAGIPH